MPDKPELDEGVHEFTEEVAQRLSEYMQTTPIDERTVAGFASSLTASKK